ncbi:MAG: hypothetical protein [Bacteriophage sp.]|jgi:hypothetical protein|nr:MAG: hypothetical protein [Bacteriophage sp.]DAI97186.1 MAG TPA: hypothetical protein [Caudoviricetes sp.]UVY55846.1 MAG: hypothetical protein [Bacteriophage sp.]UWF89125.1 MAG: hypothetical protein [Bacteriophage sp.]UWF89242.1 MAG: hypothetical protein [Bacteriophage sp.]
MQNVFVPGITYPKLQNISLKGAERMKKARAMAVLVIVAVLVCAAFAISKNSAEKRKQMIAQKYGITQENTKNVIKIEENVCKTQESDSKTQESAQEVPESVIIPGKNETGNPLIDAELQSKIVGDSLMAYIEVDKDTLKGISEEEYRAFAEEVVRNSGYRWFVIKCGDGTGIVHAGSYYACAVYGKLDTDGCIAEPYGYIYLTDNGFIYEE